MPMCLFQTRADVSITSGNASQPCDALVLSYFLSRAGELIQARMRYAF